MSYERSDQESDFFSLGGYKQSLHDVGLFVDRARTFETCEGDKAVVQRGDRERLRGEECPNSRRNVISIAEAEDYETYLALAVNATSPMSPY